MVHDHIWTAAGVHKLGGCLCIGCLEHRIGRQLCATDIEPDVPINDPQHRRRRQSLELAHGQTHRPPVDAGTAG
jgi:hypothetical protein